MVVKNKKNLIKHEVNEKNLQNGILQFFSKIIK